MRAKRYYENFSLTLLKATHENYTGTNEPRNFASRVQLRNASTKENRELLIYMNHPLRYQGLTFYQYQMTAGEMVQRQGLEPFFHFSGRQKSHVGHSLPCMHHGRRRIDHSIF